MGTSLSPAAEAQKGLAAYQSQDFPGAIQAFSLALQGYQNAGDLPAAAEVANNLSVVYLRTGKKKEAWETVKDTDLVFASVGDKRRQAMALGNQAAVLEELRQVKAAIAKYEQCAELLKETGDQENRAAVMQSISKLQLARRQPLDSLLAMQTALQNKPHLTLIDRVLKKLLQIVFRLWGF